MVLPYNQYCLCELTNDVKHTTNSNGVIFEKNELPIYRILKLSPTQPTIVEDLNLNVGDLIIINSTGIKFNDPTTKDIQYLVKYENIVAKIQQ